MVLNQNQGVQNQMAINQDPYAYLRQKQQKYKSSRSNQTNGGASSNPYYKQNTHVIANSAYLLQQKKGNQTQKANIIEKSRCSSNGSALGSASMTTTMSGIKSLSDVKNPSMFISWRFCDKQLTELKDIGSFKNLTDLDISGNQLQTEIIELRQLQFLKKLNLSNNKIKDIYPLPHNLEFLNLSNNQIKSITLEVSQHLKNLTTLDVSNNQIEDISGLQTMRRLKRIIAKNNSITTLKDLSEIKTIIEVDLESNPIEYFSQVFAGIAHKSDILLVNLKMTPATLMIQNYDQLIAELTSQYLVDEHKVLDWFKAKLKFYNNGSLYRTKRVFVRIKTVQQSTTKRSSSNFSNGSSSCGRQHANTGGRSGGGYQRGGYGGGAHTANSHKNHSSSNNQAAFSPVLNNTVTTPNYQFVSQRQEDIEQLYDEILDEEEDHERKLTKMLRRKLKRESGQQDSEDEDESFYEDEDGGEPSMSCDEDLDYLLSYRNQPPTEGTTNRILSHHHLHHIHQQLTTEDYEQNDFSSLREDPSRHGHHNQHHDILNESTADFNKEIRQINQELRDQFGPEYLNEGAVGNLDHIRSLQSTQSVSTNKKNPISFKLDLSKCTQQQSEEEDHQFKVKNKKAKKSNETEENEEDQFDIPGLNFVKVTDESFRQLQKQQSVQQSLRQKLDKLPADSALNETQKNTMREPKPQSKIIIPKLQLGQLQSMSSLHQIAIKQQSIYNQSMNQNNSKKSLCSIKTFKNEDDEVEEINNLQKVQDFNPKQLNNSKVQKQQDQTLTEFGFLQSDSRREQEETKITQNAPTLQDQIEQKLLQSLNSSKHIKSSCKKRDCLQIRERYIKLQEDYSADTEQLLKQNKELKAVLDKIRDLIHVNIKVDINELAVHLERQLEYSLEEKRTLSFRIEELEAKISEILDQKGKNETQIIDLQEQLKERNKQLSQRTSNMMADQLNLNLQFLQQNFEMKRTMSGNYDQTAALTSTSAQFNNSNNYNFYTAANLSTQKMGTTTRRDSQQNDLNGSNFNSIIENLNSQSRKKFTCDIKKIKRPQSVVGQRKSSYCIKINSLLKLDGATNQANNVSQMEDSNYVNEYGSVTQDYQRLRADAQSQGSQTHPHRASILGSVQGQSQAGQTKRVGHYIERLKERNSSLQERLNGSFGSSTQIAPLNIINACHNISPLNNQKFNNLNLTNQQQELQLNRQNPYIISPSNDEEFQLEKQPSILTGLGGLSDNGKGNQSTRRVSVFTAHISGNQRQQSQTKESTVVRRISQQESSTSVTNPLNLNLSSRDKQLSNRNILTSESQSNQEPSLAQTQQNSGGLNTSKSQYHHYSSHSKTQRLNVKKIQYNQFFMSNPQGKPIDNASANNISNGSGIPLKEGSNLAISQAISSLHSNFMTNLPSVSSQSQPTTEYQYYSQQQPYSVKQQSAQVFTQPPLLNQVSGTSQNSQKISSSNQHSSNLSQNNSSTKNMNHSQNFSNLRIQNINQTFDGSINFYPTKKSERSYLSSKNFISVAAASNQSFRESNSRTKPQVGIIPEAVSYNSNTQSSNISQRDQPERNQSSIKRQSQGKANQVSNKTTGHLVNAQQQQHQNMQAQNAYQNSSIHSHQL